MPGSYTRYDRVHSPVSATYGYALAPIKMHGCAGLRVAVLPAWVRTIALDYQKNNGIFENDYRNSGRPGREHQGPHQLKEVLGPLS